eukprot:6195021-Pleurochrysis_carterae.AAC.1
MDPWRRSMAAASGQAERLAALAAVDDAGFAALLARAANVMEGRGEIEDFSPMRAHSDDDLAEKAFLALLDILLEAVRLGTPFDEVSREYCDSLGPRRAAQVADAVRKKEEAVHFALEACTLNPAELVDVHWQRSTIVANSQNSQRGSLYSIVLTTREGANTRKLHFTANVEQLSGLVAELRRAAKQLDHECQ